MSASLQALHSPQLAVSALVAASALAAQGHPPQAARHLPHHPQPAATRLLRHQVAHLQPAVAPPPLARQAQHHLLPQWLCQPAHRQLAQHRLPPPAAHHLLGQPPQQVAPPQPGACPQQVVGTPHQLRQAMHRPLVAVRPQLAAHQQQRPRAGRPPAAVQRHRLRVAPHRPPVRQAALSTTSRVTR